MISLPPLAVAEFPDLEEPAAGDIETVRAQIGRPPRGDVLVAARCPRARPTVIMTLPYESDDPGSVPPLLWLTCPWLCLQASRLESVGSIMRIQGAIEGGGDSAMFAREEESFSDALLELAAWRGGMTPERTGRRGAAGGRPGSVKCLHAHVAYRLASGRGVAGGMCLEEIDGHWGRWCERTPDVCVP